MLSNDKTDHFNRGSLNVRERIPGLLTALKMVCFICFICRIC